jgi:inner membrane protein
LNPITHLLIGWGVASCVPSLDRRDRGIITVASVIPDLDGFGIVPELLTRDSSRPLLWWTEYHHLLGHNIGFAAIVAFLAAIFARRNLLVVPLTIISFHLHLLGDIVGARGPDGYQWPIPYLLPFSDAAQITWDGQWALNAWPNITLTVVLLAATFALAWERGFSPLGIVSERADRAFVATLRVRFGMPVGERAAA